MLRHGSSKKLISFKVNEIGPSIVFLGEHFHKTSFALDLGSSQELKQPYQPTNKTAVALRLHSLEWVTSMSTSM